MWKVTVPIPGDGCQLSSQSNQVALDSQIVGSSTTKPSSKHKTSSLRPQSGRQHCSRTFKPDKRSRSPQTGKQCDRTFTQGHTEGNDAAEPSCQTSLAGLDRHLVGSSVAEPSSQTRLAAQDRHLLNSRATEPSQPGKPSR
jgi:hypothetical protein